MKKFDLTTMIATSGPLIFVRFLEEFEDTINTIVFRVIILKCGYA